MGVNMTRSIIVGGLGIFFGAYIGYFLQLPFLLALIFLLTSSLLFVFWKKESFAFAIFAFALGILLISNQESRQNLADLEGRYYQGTGVVESLYGDYHGYKSYIVEIRSIGGEKYVEKVLLGIRTENYFQPGDFIKADFAFEEIRPGSNPGLFDYQAYMKIKGVFARGQARNFEIIGRENNIFREIKSKSLSYINKEINRGISQDNAGFMEEVITTDSKMSEEYREEIRTLGLSHIMAVSGLHMGIIVGFLLIILQAIGLHRNLSYGIILAFMGFYLYISGFPSSALRSALMIGLSMLARILHKGYSPKKALGFSVFIIILTNPYRALDIGLVLSVLAIVGILWVEPQFSPIDVETFSLTSSLRLTFIINLVLLPFLFQYFSYFNPLSILANLIIVPVFTLALQLSVGKLIVGLILPGISMYMGVLVDVLLNVIRFFTANLSAYSSLTFNLPMPGGLIILYYLLLFLFLRARYDFRNFKSHTWQGFLNVLLVISLGHGISLAIYDPVYVDFIDIGQGDACLIRRANRAILIDTGGDLIGESSYKFVLKPFIEKHVYGGLDGVFISHGDVDHSGNLPKLVEEGLVKNVYGVGENLAYKVNELRSGQVFNLNPGIIRIIDDGREGKNSNDSSVLMSFEHQGTRVLFTGDLEFEGEKRNLGKDIRANILKVGHHGSKGSTSEDFLEEVKPSLGVISAGYKNSYGHPHQETLERLDKYNVKVLRTDKSGCISFVLTRFGPVYKAYLPNKLTWNHGIIFFFMIVFSLELVEVFLGLIKRERDELY